MNLANDNMGRLFLLAILFVFFRCADTTEKKAETKVVPKTRTQKKEVSLVVLGTVQDAGSPHIGCRKQCCSALFEHSDPTKKVVSLGLVDHKTGKTYLFEATPDIAAQLKHLQRYAESEEETPDGIFLTHAHMGHYSGLMYLGREALNSEKLPVYAMPKMKTFLKDNGPWSQLVSLSNISLVGIEDQGQIVLTPNIVVTPFLVPHRDEFSETVGYKISGPAKTVLFIPDIDKWHLWKKSIVEEISKVDYAFLDATFYDAAEIDNRDISEIPHPFVIESLALFGKLPDTEKKKIYFIHFNHTNPLLDSSNPEREYLKEKGFQIAEYGQLLSL